MWNEPTYRQLQRIPPLYATESTPWEKKTIYEHFFIGSSDWYAAEYDPNNRLFFGFAVLNNDLQCGEWGYFGLDELRGIDVRGIQVDRDLHWEEQPAGDIETIVKSMTGDY
ncbi:MAG: DUF2958 domain-containing protein [Phycisphaeraceae bacterium]|nr:DUF2958 domain-containing protein [Phycisphaeraceae bacterium]